MKDIFKERISELEKALLQVIRNCKKETEDSKRRGYTMTFADISKKVKGMYEFKLETYKLNIALFNQFDDEQKTCKFKGLASMLK